MKNKIDIVGKPPISKKIIEKCINSSLETLNISPSKEIVEILFVSPKKIKLLNYKYLQKNKVTDVLSFPQKKFQHNNIFGSIVICPDYAQTNNQNIEELLIHGILHLAGYDHDKDIKKWKKAKDKIKINY